MLWVSLLGIPLHNMLCAADAQALAPKLFALCYFFGVHASMLEDFVAKEEQNPDAFQGDCVGVAYFPDLISTGEEKRGVGYAPRDFSSGATNPALPSL